MYEITEPPKPWWWKKRWWAAGLLALLTLPPGSVVAFALWSEHRPAVPRSLSAQLHVGMTGAEVRGLLGAPRHVLPRGDGTERWVFDRGTPARHHVEFGPEGRLKGHWEDR